jgi:hypothetical protein
MHPHDTLKSLCHRHGVAEEFGLRLLPLLERAEGAPPDVRERLLGLVEQSLARESERQRELRQDVRRREELALLNVARALHSWEPPRDFDPERANPEELDPRQFGPDGLDLDG